jgi:hypothetical protein
MPVKNQPILTGILGSPMVIDERRIMGHRGENEYQTRASKVSTDIGSYRCVEFCRHPEFISGADSRRRVFQNY